MLPGKLFSKPGQLRGRHASLSLFELIFIYHLLRNQALSATPAQLRLNVDNTSPTVYGIVMDYDLGPAIATVTAFKTGDAESA